MDEYCGSFKVDAAALPRFRRKGVPLYGDVYAQIGQNAYRAMMDSTLRDVGTQDHMCLRLAKAGSDGIVDMSLTADTWTSLPANLQAEMLRDCLGRLSSSTQELGRTTSCKDGQKLQRLQRYIPRTSWPGCVRYGRCVPFLPGRVRHETPLAV